MASAATTIAIMNYTGIFDDASYGSEVYEDGKTYRGVAWWLLSLGIFGIVTQTIMFFIRVLYYTGRFESHFVVFGILASLKSMYAHLFIYLQYTTYTSSTALNIIKS